jgi:DNA-binding MarR family transcriptional regulator
MSARGEVQIRSPRLHAYSANDKKHRGGAMIDAETARMGSRAAVAAAGDLESRAEEHHHDSLRLWLRLLACTMLIERTVRTRLFRRFGTTLPRFDLMAQLERSADGLRMGELSRRMMVTGGNVTGIVDQLVTEALVERRPIATDRRALAVRLTPKGRRRFLAMAAEHERWIQEILSDLPVAERARLYAMLGHLKAVIRGDAAGVAASSTGDPA